MKKYYICACAGGQPSRRAGLAGRAGLAALALGSLLSMRAYHAHAQAAPLRVAVTAHGVYSIGEASATTPAIVSAVAAEVDGRSVRTTDYPRCDLVRAQTQGYRGQA